MKRVKQNSFGVLRKAFQRIGVKNHDEKEIQTE